MTAGTDRAAARQSPTITTGVEGLDAVLCGGLPPDRFYLVEGDPGTGKTTLALQFLLAGVARGERTLYVTLSESAEELRAVAASHGWTLDGIDLYELSPSEDRLDPDEEYTVLHPSDVELGDTMNAVMAEVTRVRPTRAVFDSLSEMRLLARDPLRYRRQILALKQFFSGRRCTVLLLDDLTAKESGLESISHGVILLERSRVQYGRTRRRLEIMKLRGVGYREGYHDVSIVTGGVIVYPRLIAAAHHAPFERDIVASGVSQLDALLGGGLERGTSALLIGPSGVGKSIVATQYAIAAARRNQHAAIYIFDEGVQTFIARSRGLQLDVAGEIERGRMTLRQIDPAELSPGEFVHQVRQAVERDSARVIVIDGLNGYLNAMPEERLLVVQMHELLTYLNQQGVLTLLIIAQHGIVGQSLDVPVDISYLADTVVLLRFFEAAGRVGKAISVVKRRSGPHEETIRELQLGPGIRVGEPLSGFQGVLTGVPVLTNGSTYAGR